MLNLQAKFVAIRGLGANMVAKGALNTKAQKADFNKLIVRAEQLSLDTATEADRKLAAERILARAATDLRLPSAGESRYQTTVRAFYAQAARILNPTLEF